ncbi:UROS [Symbiodinium sp. CCMP2456]|nr:UROS [Symbiodinium sp. CCMP2456]
MALALHYRFTFITVEEEPVVQLKRRAASVPPRPSAAELCEAQENEVEDGRYVKSLQQKWTLGRAGPEPVCAAQEQEDGQDVQSLEPIFAYKEVELQSNASTEEPMVGHVPSEEIPSEGDESPKEGKPKCNPGSAGHPELCRRPCIYFALGQCINEADCNFCHLSHNNRSATLDKCQRQMIKHMSQHEFLSMLLHSLQSKAAEGRFEVDAEDVLQLFRVQIGQMRAIPSKVPKTKILNLEKALTRMTFFSVASLTSRGSFDTGFIELCKEKVTFLRQKVA